MNGPFQNKSPPTFTKCRANLWLDITERGEGFWAGVEKLWLSFAKKSRMFRNRYQKNLEK
jgi:hypothetical protein